MMTVGAAISIPYLCHPARRRGARAAAVPLPVIALLLAALAVAALPRRRWRWLLGAVGRSSGRRRNVFEHIRNHRVSWDKDPYLRHTS